MSQSNMPPGHEIALPPRDHFRFRTDLVEEMDFDGYFQRGPCRYNDNPLFTPPELAEKDAAFARKYFCDYKGLVNSYVFRGILKHGFDTQLVMAIDKNLHAVVFEREGLLDGLFARATSLLVSVGADPVWARDVFRPTHREGERAFHGSLWQIGYRRDTGMVTLMDRRHRGITRLFHAGQVMPQSFVPTQPPPPTPGDTAF